MLDLKLSVYVVHLKYEFVLELVSFHNVILLRYEFGHVPGDVDIAST